VRTKHDVFFLLILNTALKPNPTQYGFQPLHSTTTALLPLITAIATGFNQQKPAIQTAAQAIDFSVHHPTLLQKISNSNLHSNYLIWLATYVRGRIAACFYQSAVSPKRIIRSGVPPGFSNIAHVIQLVPARLPLLRRNHHVIRRRPDPSRHSSRLFSRCLHPFRLSSIRLHPYL